MSLIAAEQLPWLAAVGLGACVVAVVLLPTFRDPASISALEASAEAPIIDGSQSASAKPAPQEKEGPSTSKTSAKIEPERSVPEPKPVKDEAITEATIDRASTLAEAKALAERAPKDVRVLKKLARVQGTSTDPDALRDAMITVKALLSLDDGYASDKDITQVVGRAAAGPQAAQDLAFELMTGRMKTFGPDLVYELTIAPSVPVGTKQRALELTRSDDFKKKTSPALRVALDLRDRAPCERRAILDEVVKSGDRRSLGYLTPMTKKKGCGVFTLGDCYDCFGNRTELTKAINAINAR